MRTISLKDLHLTAERRPAGYVYDVLAQASEVTETHYTISDEAWQALREKYTEPIQLIPRAKWPRWAKLLAKIGKSPDKGVGDTVARYAAKIGGEQFKKWSARLGMPCGCTERQAEWNAAYSYAGQS